MHDALRQVQPAVDQLAAVFAITPAKANAVLRAVVPELAWHLETMTLSRGGLAGLVELLGGHRATARPANGVDLRGETAGRMGEEALVQVLGTPAASRTLAARAAWQCGVDADTIAGMLPHLAAVMIGGLALRANAGLAGILAQVPPLGRLSRGSPHADLAGILRRRCGAGAYSPRALPRAVRRAVSPAVASRGIVTWYLSFMVGRRGMRLLRNLVAWSQGPGRPAAGVNL